MMKRTFKITMGILLLSFLVMIIGVQESYASTVQDITLSNFKVSDSSPQLGDTIEFTFHINVPEGKEIIDIQWSIQQGYGGSCGSGMQILGGSSYDATITSEIIYYGVWNMEYIFVKCADGTNAFFYNDDYGKDSENLEDNEYILDMSGFVATVQDDPQDTTPPVLNTKIEVSQTLVDIKENVTIGFDISDDVSVAYAWPMIKLGNGGLCAYGNLIYNETSGLWETNVVTDYAGTYEFESIIIVDTSGNYTYVYNSAYSGIKDTIITDNAVMMDLSAANFKTKFSNSDDEKGPYIDISSLRVTNKNIGLWDYNEITLKVTDDSAIVQVDVSMKQGQGGICGYGGGFQYDATRKLYVCNVQGQFYGTWEIADISAVDVNGNRTIICNSAYSEEYQIEGSTLEDMSSANFDVGLKDEKTDVFISGDGMETDVTMDVSELDTSDNNYEVLIEEGYEKDTYVNIKVNGQYNKGNKKVKVKFKPKYGKEGDKVRIRHLLKNGEIQTVDAVIKDGYVVIEVDEFSPFLLEYNGRLKKGNTFSFGGNIYKVKTVGRKKGTVIYKGTTKKRKNITIPKTIKKNGITFTVTEIGVKALKGNTKLVSVVIPKGVTKIGEEAFKGCKKLKKITIKSTKIKSVGKNAFKNINKKAVIKVPKKKYSKYKKIFTKKKSGYKKTMKIKKETVK